MPTGSLHGLTNNETWAEQALCSQTDPEVFFPEQGGSTRDAKKVCYACPVRAECLSYALRTDQRFGIFGGLSERERRRLKNGIAPPPPRTHCIHGHELAKVGVTSQRYCNECRRKAGREYQARITAKYGKPA